MLFCHKHWHSRPLGGSGGLMLVVSWGRGQGSIQCKNFHSKVSQDSFTKSKLLPSSGSVGYMRHNARNRFTSYWKVMWTDFRDIVQVTKIWYDNILDVQDHEDFVWRRILVQGSIICNQIMFIYKFWIFRSLKLNGLYYLTMLKLVNDTITAVRRDPLRLTATLEWCWRRL